MEETVAEPGLFKKPLPATLIGVEQGGPIHAHFFDEFESLNDGAA